MTEMQSGSTNIGGILSAMVYQIEQDNIKAKNKAPPTGHNNSAMILEEKSKSSLHGPSISNMHSIDINSEAAAGAKDQQQQEEKNKLASQLDDMYNCLVIEHGVVTTDYSH